MTEAAAKHTSPFTQDTKMAQNGLFPVSLTRHGSRFWRRFSSYAFAGNLQSYPITTAEVLQAAASFPVVFKQTGQQIEPCVLLSLNNKTKTPFVSEDGRWLGIHIPSGLRCYPFQAVACQGSSETALLMIDESSGLVTRDPGDEAFFKNGDQLTQELCAVRAFLQERLLAVKETQKLCHKIAGQNLFSPIDHHDGIQIPAGFLEIKPVGLRRLTQNQISTLMNSGALRLIHAHHVSLSHCRWLFSAQQARKTQIQVSENVRDFLGAMGNETGFETTPEARHAAG
ncbi:MAG: SapC family protein [Ruegeria sp.]